MRGGFLEQVVFGTLRVSGLMLSMIVGEAVMAKANSSGKSTKERKSGRAGLREEEKFPSVGVWIWIWGK